jgi:recombination protein RecA
MAKRGRPKKSLTDKLIEERQKEKVREDQKFNKMDVTPLIENNNQIPKEQQEKLNSVLRDLNKKGIDINYANLLEIKQRQAFGHKYLDELTGGGIPCGNFTTIWGSKGCGKTSIAYKMMATAQKEGKVVVYIDMERSYDSEWAATMGVDVNSLIYVRCHLAEEALDTIIKLCKEKVVNLIVLDSIQGLSPKGENVEGKGEKEKSVEDDTMALLARKLSQFFRMSVSHVSDAKCAILLIGQARMDLGSFIKMETLSGGHALLHNSRLILRIRRGQKADAPCEKIETEEGKTEKQIIGFDCVIRVEKSQIQNCTENDELHLPFYYESGLK